MNAFDAAYQVLNEAGEPLHYREIARRMIASGLWTEYRGGETPHATVGATLSRDIRHHGDAARFRFVDRGVYAINTAPGKPTWMPPSLVREIENHNDQMCEGLLRQALQGTPAEFEELVATLLRAMGFEDVTQTPISSDGGIDVRGTLTVSGVVRIRMAVQVKRWTRNVGRPTVQQVRGSLSPHEQGLIITTSGFTRDARDEAARTDAFPVALMDGKHFARLLAEHELGVKRNVHHLLAPPD